MFRIWTSEMRVFLLVANQNHQQKGSFKQKRHTQAFLFGVSPKVGVGFQSKVDLLIPFSRTQMKTCTHGAVVPSFLLSCLRVFWIRTPETSARLEHGNDRVICLNPVFERVIIIAQWIPVASEVRRDPVMVLLFCSRGYPWLAT